MKYTQHEKGAQRASEHLPIGTIQLGDTGENERQRHVLGKVGMRPRADLQVVVCAGLLWYDGFSAGRLAVFLRRVVADPVLIAKPDLYASKRQIQEVGREG